ncbi:MAG: YIP1 family protein [Planctomycetes bacterium]|nr:YIP1 family protein [Planctomycetota bacterium]
MPSELVNIRRKTVGVADIPRVLVAPRRVFERVEDVPAYAWPMVLLLVAVTLVGYATVETGLIDREVERQVQRSIAALDVENSDVVERSALSKAIEDKRKEGEFFRLMTHVQVVVARPAATLATILLLSAVLYGLVALTGKKPEWHTLLTVCTFASFVDLLRLLMQLGLMLRFKTLEVDTSLAPLVQLIHVDSGISQQAAAAISGALTAADPFRIWFWLIVIVGLSTTAQLRGWKVGVTAFLFWLIAGGVRTALAVATVASMSRA